MPEWGIALIGVAGLLLGIIITEVRHWLDRKQRFQVMTFEKRLEAHQEAFSLCYELLYDLSIDKADDDKYKTIRKIDKWWDNNCLFLDEISRKEMLILIREAYDRVSKLHEKPSTVFAQIEKTRNAIVQGIGAQHLPEKPKEEKKQES